QSAEMTTPALRRSSSSFEMFIYPFSSRSVAPIDDERRHCSEHVAMNGSRQALAEPFEIASGASGAAASEIPGVRNAAVLVDQGSEVLDVLCGTVAASGAEQLDVEYGAGFTGDHAPPFESIENGAKAVVPGMGRSRPLQNRSDACALDRARMPERVQDD